MRPTIHLVLALIAALVAAPVGVAQQPDDYLLGAGDVVKITVFQNPDLTTETRVAETGAITFPLVASIDVSGRSTSTAERMIAQKLREGGAPVMAG